MKIGMLLSTVSKEQKHLFEAAKQRGITFERLDDRRIIFDLGNGMYDYDVILERCVNHSRSLYALKVLNAHGVNTVNTYDVARICGNKFLTTMALINHNTDMGDGWEWSNAEDYPGYIRYTAQSYRMMINEVVYALTH